MQSSSYDNLSIHPYTIHSDAMRCGKWVSGFAAGAVLGLYLGICITEHLHLDRVVGEMAQRATLLEKMASLQQQEREERQQPKPLHVATSIEEGNTLPYPTQDGVAVSGPDRNASQKIVVWTTDYFTGGPEALFQLVLALHRRGHRVYRTSDLAPELRAFYPDWADVPFVPFPEIDRVVSLGDIIIIPEEQSCPDLDRFPFGVRKAKWILAGDGHGPQPPCTLLHHSFELARAIGSPMSTVLMPYIHRNRSGLILDSKTLVNAKRNTVCVAAHNVPHLADVLRNSTFLHTRIPDLEVQLVKGMTPAEVVELLTRCKVLVDGSLPGLERLPLEAATFGANLVFNPSTGIPEHYLDMPLPLFYLGPWPDERDAADNATRFERVVARAMLEYPAEVGKFEPLRHRIKAMEAQFVEAVDRTVREAAAFVIPCEASTDGELCLLAAISVLLASPLSLVHVVLESTDTRDAYLQRHADLLATMRAMHMEGLVAIHETQKGSDWGMDEVFDAAPNHRVFVLAADAVVTHPFGRVREEIQQSMSSLDNGEVEITNGTLSWANVHEVSRQHPVFEMETGGGWRVPVSDTAGLPVVSLRATLEGKAILDQKHLEAFTGLCGQSLWRRATGGGSSPRWERLCIAIRGGE